MEIRFTHVSGLAVTLVSNSAISRIVGHSNGYNGHSKVALRYELVKYLFNFNIRERSKDE